MRCEFHEESSDNFERIWVKRIFKGCDPRFRLCGRHSSAGPPAELFPLESTEAEPLSKGLLRLECSCGKRPIISRIWTFGQ